MITETPPATPGLQLKVWRVRHQIKQSDAAARLGVSTSHLSNIESGAGLPGRNLAVRIEDMTGIPARDWSTVATEGETVEMEARR